MIIDSELYRAGLIGPHIWMSQERIILPGPEDLDGDFTLVGWYKEFQASVLPVRLWNLGSGFIVDIVDNGGVHQLKVHDGDIGISPDITDNLTTDGTTWTCIIIRRSGTTISTFEGKTKLSDTTISVVNYGATIRAINSSIEVADLRVISKALSDAAIEYYYDDVIENEGDETHPRW